MADYSDAYSLYCCNGSTITGHTKSCASHPLAEYLKTGKKHNMSVISITQGPADRDVFLAYRCLNGCGTLVWDVEAHIKNVCRTPYSERQ